MSNLSHWDYAESFTGREAAALILGLDPITDDLAVIEPLLRRMNDAYTATLRAYLREEWLGSIKWVEGYISIGDDDQPFKPTNLHSLRMTAYYGETGIEGEDSKLRMGVSELADDRFNRWLHDDLRNGFDHQLFIPFELDRWLKALGLRTAYRFMGESEESEDNLDSSDRIQHTTKERRDLLTPVIELAQGNCKRNWDAAEVWAKLKQLAIAKHLPLNGVDESGIQYFDANDTLKTLNIGALRMRLTRARYRTIGNGK